MSSDRLDFLADLENIIRQRLAERPEDSYTASLAAAGDKRMAQKVGEEAVELALATVAGDRAEQISEAADLLFHTMVLLVGQGLSLADVVAELQSRHAD